MAYNCVYLKDQNSLNMGYKVNPPFPLMDDDTLKWLRSYPKYEKCRSNK